jgi:hypothetical protein
VPCRDSAAQLTALGLCAARGVDAPLLAFPPRKHSQSAAGSQLLWDPASTRSGTGCCSGLQAESSGLSSPGLVAELGAAHVTPDGDRNRALASAAVGRCFCAESRSPGVVPWAAQLLTAEPGVCRAELDRRWGAGGSRAWPPWLLQVFCSATLPLAILVLPVRRSGDEWLLLLRGPTEPLLVLCRPSPPLLLPPTGTPVLLVRRSELVLAPLRLSTLFSSSSRMRAGTDWVRSRLLLRLLDTATSFLCRARNASSFACCSSCSNMIA